jgi:hypothetical protein
VGQAKPQLPQLAAFELVLTHVPSQLASPLGQPLLELPPPLVELVWQAPRTQVAPAGQTFAQVPQ